MSIIVAERKAIETLRELQKIKLKLKLRGRPPSNEREIDRIRNAVVKKIVNGQIPAEYISVDYLSFGCQILTTEAEEIYAYLKAVRLI